MYCQISQIVDLAKTHVVFSSMYNVNTLFGESRAMCEKRQKRQPHKPVSILLNTLWGASRAMCE